MNKMNKEELMNEYKEIKENQSWKPSEGLYEVTFLDLPEKDTFQRTNEKNEIVETTPLRLFKVKVEYQNGNTATKTWEMGVGKTSKSVYYQLLEQFKMHGQVKGVKITLRVEEGKRKSYHVLKSSLVDVEDFVEEEVVEE